MSRSNQAVFILRNLLHAIRMPHLPLVSISGDVQLAPYRSSDRTIVNQLYRDYADRGLSLRTKVLLSLVGARLCFVARKEANLTIGVQLFYFNERDHKENTIHEGFVAVAPAYQGQNIASTMRLRSLQHFKHCGLAGVSSRVRSANAASLKSAQKAGFLVAEKRGDEFYLIAG